MARHLAIALFLARASIQTQAQYRVDFLVQLALAVFWVIWNVAPLWLVFEIRPELAGWTRPQAMLVMSAFLIQKAVLEGLITPNLVALVDRIRTGTLDFLLLKPADAQVMVSFAKVVPAKAMDLLVGLAIAAASIARLDPAPPPRALLAGAAMLAAGALVLYAVWIMVACVAFWVVKIDNLSFLFTSLFDAGRWPISVFRGWVRTVLTWVLPIAAMTSFPALAVLERLDLTHALWAWGLTAGLLVASRLAWRQAVLHYASASS